MAPVFSLFMAATGVIWAAAVSSPTEAAIFFGGLLLIVYLPGRFIVAVSSLDGKKGESLLLSLLAGMVSITSMYWIFSAIGQRQWFLIVVALGAAAGLAVTIKSLMSRDHTWEDISIFSFSSWYWPGFFVVYLAVILVLHLSGYFNAIGIGHDGSASIANFPDDGLFHAGIVHELLRNIPPGSILVSGYGLNYSYFMDLFAALFHSLLGLEIMSLLYVLLPLFFFGLLILSIYVTVSALSGSSLSALLCTFLVILGGGMFNFIPGLVFLGWDGGRWELAFHASTTVPLFFINPMLPGLAVFYGALLCIERSFKTSAPGWAIMAGILTAALSQYKIFGTAIIISGLAGTAFLLLLKHKRLPHLFPILTIIGISLPLIFYHTVTQSDATQVSTRLAPASFLILSLEYLGLKTLAAQMRDILVDFRPGFEGVLWVLILMPSHIAGSMGIRIFGLPSLMRPVFSFRAIDPMKVFLGCSFLAGLLLTYLVSVTPRDYPGAYNNSVWFYAFSLHIATISVSQTIPSFLSRGTRWLRILMLASAMAAGFLSIVQYLFWSSENRKITHITPYVMQAIEYIKARTPPESIILLDPSGEKGEEDSSIITGLAGRRLLLSGSYLSIYQAPAREIQIRVKSISEFLMDPCRNRGLPDAHRVDFVWIRKESSGGGWGDALRCRGFSLEKVFENKEVQIYRVFQ